jgi:hypothetical protein
MSNKSNKNDKFILMMQLQNKLNGELGDLWWNKYVGAAFWSNISTPINLSITLLSAITAGQAITEKLLSQNLFFKISVASLLLSTLNTFFRPHSQLMENMNTIKAINEFGAKFETIYYSENSTYTDFDRKYNEYKKLSQEFNKYLIEQTPEQQNFITDLIYWLFRKYSCLKNSYKWLDVDMSYSQDEKINQDECCPPSSCCVPGITNLPVLEEELYKNQEENNDLEKSNNNV